MDTLHISHMKGVEWALRRWVADSVGNYTRSGHILHKEHDNSDNQRQRHQNQQQ